MTGIVILGHGSKAEEANAALGVIVDMVKTQLKVENIEAAFLQFCQPDLKEAVRRLVEKGLNKIVIVPFFLYKGIHILEDVPGELAQLQEEYKGVEMIFARHLDNDPRMAEILVDRIREVS